MSTDEVIAEVSKDKVFYGQSGGGVTFSGGEPFLQGEFLLSLLRAAGAGNVHTAVDTSGYVSPALLDQASDSIDLFLYDIKVLDDAKHREFTGVSNTLILENLRRLVGRRKQVVVRVPIIPAINDRPAEIRGIGEFVTSLGGISEVHILPYHKSGIDKYRRLGQEYGMEHAGQVSAESLGLIAAELTRYVPRVVIGG
jgi:pyruvate formate lyase activating enzyme